MVRILKATSDILIDSHSLKVAGEAHYLGVVSRSGKIFSIEADYMITKYYRAANGLLA